MQNLATAHLYKKHQFATIQPNHLINRDIKDIGLVPLEQSPQAHSRLAKPSLKNVVYCSDQADGRRSQARRQDKHGGKNDSKMPKIVERQASKQEEYGGNEVQMRTQYDSRKQINSLGPSRNSRGEKGQKQQMQQVFQNIESIREQLINERFDGTLLNDHVKSVRHSQLSLDYQYPKQHTSSQYKTLDAHATMTGSKQQLFLNKIPNGHPRQAVQLPTLPSYDKRSKSIQNSQHIDGLKFGNEFAQNANDKSRMRATYVNQSRTRTIDVQEQAKDIYYAPYNQRGSLQAGSVDHDSRIRALKDIDRDIRQALNHAKIESAAQSLVQSTAGRFSKVNFHFDGDAAPRSGMDKYDLWNPQNRLSNQTFQQKILGNASKVNFDLKPQVRAMNRVKMESWKQPQQNAKCSSIMRIMKKFKTELYADQVINQSGQRNGMNHSELVYRLNQSSEKELDSFHEDNNWLALSQTTMQQMADTGFQSIREKLEQYMSPSYLKRKMAFKEQQFRSHTQRLPEAAESSQINFPTISLSKLNETDQPDQNKATINKFAQLLNKSQRPTLIASRLVKNYLNDFGNAEGVDSGKQKSSNLQEQQVTSNTQLQLTQREFKARNMTLNDRKFEKFKQLLFKESSSIKNTTTYDKTRQKFNSSKARTISHSVMTNLHDQSSPHLLEASKLSIRKTEQSAPRHPRQSSRSPKLSLEIQELLIKKDQKLSPRKDDDDSSSSRHSPTVSKGNESRERINPQDVTPSITQLNQHIQRTEQMQKIQNQQRMSDDEEQDVTMKTPVRQQSQRKSSVEVAQEERGTGIGGQIPFAQERSHEASPNQLNQTLPLLRQNRKMSKAKFQEQSSPNQTSSDNKGINFLQKVQNEALKFHNHQRLIEQPTNERTTPTALNKTEPTMLENQDQMQRSGMHRSSIYDSINVTHGDFFKNNKMSPKLFHLNQTNQNQSFTPYKLDKHPDLELAKQSPKALQQQKQDHKAKKISLEVKGKSKQLGSMQEWLIRNTITQRQIQLKDQTDKDQKIKIIRQNVEATRNALSPVSKGFENGQSEQRILTNAKEEEERSLKLTFQDTRNVNINVASNHHLFSEGTHLIQSPDRSKQAALDMRNLYTGINGSRLQQSPILRVNNDGKNLMDVWERGSNHLQTLQDMQSANGTGITSAANIQQVYDHGNSNMNQRQIVQQINQSDSNQASMPNLHFQNHSPNSPLLINNPVDGIVDRSGGIGSQLLQIQDRDSDIFQHKSKKVRNQYRKEIIKQQIQDRAKMSKINLVFNGKEVPGRKHQRNTEQHSPPAHLRDYLTSSTDSKGKSSSPLARHEHGIQQEMPQHIKQVLNLPATMNTSTNNVAPTVIDHSISIKDAQYPSESVGELSPTMAQGRGMPMPLPKLLKPGQIKEMELSSEGEDGPDGERGTLGSKHHIIQIIDSDKNLQNLSHLRSIQQLQQLASMHSLHTEDAKKKHHEHVIHQDGVQVGGIGAGSRQKLSVVNLDLNLVQRSQERVHTVMGHNSGKNATKHKQRSPEKPANESSSRFNREVDMFSQQKLDIQFQVQSKQKLQLDTQRSQQMSKMSTKQLPSNTIPNTVNTTLRTSQQPNQGLDRSPGNQIRTGGENIGSQSRGKEMAASPGSPASASKEVKNSKSHAKNKEPQTVTSNASRGDQDSQKEGKQAYIHSTEQRQSSSLRNKQESSPLKTPKDNKSLKSSQIFAQTMSGDVAARVGRQLSSIENTSQKAKKTDRHDINQWQIQSVQSVVGEEHQMNIEEEKTPPQRVRSLEPDQQSSSMATQQEPKLPMKSEVPNHNDAQGQNGHKHSPALTPKQKTKKTSAMHPTDSKRSLNQQSSKATKKHQTDKKTTSNNNSILKSDKNIVFNNQIIRDMHNDDQDQADPGQNQAEAPRKGSKTKLNGASKVDQGDDNGKSN